MDAEMLEGIDDDLDIFRIEGGPTSCAERHRFIRCAIDTSCSTCNVQCMSTE